MRNNFLRGIGIAQIMPKLRLFLANTYCDIFEGFSELLGNDEIKTGKLYKFTNSQHGFTSACKCGSFTNSLLYKMDCVRSTKSSLNDS